MKYRIGQGYDIHRLVSGRPLILGGVTVPFELGLEGHSDGDALIHAVIDAILGAAGCGDIGTYFPDTDDEWAGAPGEELLRRVLALSIGWRVVNVDVTVVAEAPKIAPHRETIRDNLASILGIDADAVGIKAKTNEGLDAVGEKRAIACFAVALLEQNDAEHDEWL